jgi:hypothetical protein
VTTLLAARRLALYLFSLLAMAGSEIAWGQASPGRLLRDAGFLALALVLGEAVADALSGLGAAAWRRKARLAALALYSILAFVALGAGTAGGELAAAAVSAMGLLQLVLFVVADFLGLRPAVLANLLLLVLLTGLAGGLPASIAAVGTVGLLPFYLALDRLASRLGALPSARPPPQTTAVVGSVTRDTARLVAPIALLLAGYFVWAPPAPLASPTTRAAAMSAEAPEAYRWLTVMALLGGGLVMALARLLRGRGEDATALVEDQETLVVAEEDLEPERQDDSRYGPGRGRVILAYVRFLSRARHLGHEIGLSLTPREIEGRLPAAAPPLALLTTAFMDARYGPDEPPPDGIRAAEAASRELQRTLGPQRKRRRSAP